MEEWVGLQLSVPTLSVETKSAVSSNVSWLIWSTIPETFGFEVVAALASLDCHLRPGYLRRLMIGTARALMGDEADCGIQKAQRLLEEQRETIAAICVGIKE